MLQLTDIKPIELISQGLAAYRLANMLVNEDGPYDIFKRLREATGFKYDDVGQIESLPSNNVLSCFLCTSVYSAAIFRFAPKVAVDIFALSAIAIIVDRYINSSPFPKLPPLPDFDRMFPTTVVDVDDGESTDSNTVIAR